MSASSSDIKYFYHIRLANLDPVVSTYSSYREWAMEDTHSVVL